TAQKIPPCALRKDDRMAHGVLTTKGSGHLALLNRFNASNSARSSQAAQAQSFFLTQKKFRLLCSANLVQVHTNRLAVPRQVQQYGIA
ncbi:MAG TPA: hypothetical protein VN974_12535, partial [Candidatus Dormibacteraeota bacterium]|nr:hypothetical protein [Candidatus Dormibacteraeota bacterium]